MSLAQDEIGAIRYQVTPLNCSAEICFEPFLDGNIINQDKNWNDQFWDILSISSKSSNAFIEASRVHGAFILVILGLYKTIVLGVNEHKGQLFL